MRRQQSNIRDFAFTKTLTEKDEDSTGGTKWELFMMMVTNQGWDNESYSGGKIHILSSVSERYLEKMFLDERDASVDCVIVLYDWKLIIYSLVPTRLILLCLPCSCCCYTLNTLAHLFVWYLAESLIRGSVSVFHLQTGLAVHKQTKQSESV